jgi:hypothetical protein
MEFPGADSSPINERGGRPMDIAELVFLAAFGAVALVLIATA